MPKIQAVSIPEFMKNGFPAPSNPVIQHFKKHHKLYIHISGLAISCLIVGFGDPTIVHAAGTQTIDIKAHHIYSKLCMIGKWIIVVRGGVDIISTMTQGELDTMKKKIIGYVIGYLALLGLPWILDQANALFNDPDMSLT